jgi:hypothetical protein
MTEPSHDLASSEVYSALDTLCAESTFTGTRFPSAIWFNAYRPPLNNPKAEKLNKLSSTANDSPEFKDCLLEAVDYGLNVLGDIVRTAIYRHLQHHHKLERTSIPERLEDFHRALEELFGLSAARVETLIAKALYQRCGLHFTKVHGWTLVEYANDALIRLPATKRQKSK